MPSKQRYHRLKAEKICTECAHREATNGTRCERCYLRNQTAKVLVGVENFTALDLQVLKAKSDGRCLICQRAVRLVFDHCHLTRKARGFICNNCNRGLGLFQDSAELLRKAANYLDGFGRTSS